MSMKPNKQWLVVVGVPDTGRTASAQFPPNEQDKVVELYDLPFMYLHGSAAYINWCGTDDQNASKPS